MGGDRDQGRGSKASRDSGSGRGAAPYVVTEDSHSSEQQKPRTLLQALSDIQQYYVMESRGDVIPLEILTLQGTFDYMAVGMRSGFKEGLLLFLLLPLMEFYLLPKLINPDRGTTLLFQFIPILPLMGYTFICSYMSRYYTGNITKRCISSVLSGRVATLVIKAALLWFVYQIIYAFGSPDRVWRAFKFLGESAATKAYYWFFEIKPFLRPAANRSALILLAGALVPYAMLYVMGHYKKWKILKNARYVKGSIN